MSNNLNATYVTHAGAAEEALAMLEGRKLQLVKIIVGTGKLPDNLDPKDQTKLIAKIDETPAFTHVGKVAGEFMSDGDLPIPDVGYNYWEIGTVTDTGVLYTYTRAIGDYVPGKNDQVSKVSRPRLYFKTQNSEVITITEDKTLQYVAVPDFEAHVMEFNAHCDATNPHPQYMHNDEHASEAEAIAGVTSAKWMSCLRWLQAFKSRLSNSYSGTRTDYAASEKALSDGLGTRLDKNKDKATSEDAALGVNDSKFSTPSKVADFVKQFGIGGYLNDISVYQGRLNDLKYTCFCSVNSSYTEDLPPHSATGYDLIVLARASSYVIQMAFPINGDTSQVFFRHMTANAWGEWDLLVSEKYLRSQLFLGDLSENGWRLEPDGHISMWGKIHSFVLNGDAVIPITFPTSFPNKVFEARWGLIAPPTGKNVACYVNNVTQHGMDLIADKDAGYTHTVEAYWFARGK